MSTFIAGSRLEIGGQWMTDNTHAALTLQTDGNLVIVDRFNNQPLWAAMTNGTSADLALMQDDGNFVVYDTRNAANWTPLWDTGTWNHPGATLRFEDDGTIHIHDADGTVLWSNPNPRTVQLAREAGSALSDFGPSLSSAPGDGKIWLAWRGPKNTQSLNVMSIEVPHPGDDWINLKLDSPQAVRVGSTSHAPTMAVFNGQEHLIWKGRDADPRLWHSTLGPGGWAQQAVIPNVGTSDSPTAIPFGGKLFAVWKGAFTDPGIYYSSTSDGINWAPQGRIPGAATDTAPGFAGFEGQLCVSWRGAGSDQQIYCSFSGNNAASWTEPQPVPNALSNFGPSMGVGVSTIDNGALYFYLIWKGMVHDAQHDDTGIWSTIYDHDNRGHWDAVRPFYGQTTSGKPAVLGYGPSTFAAWKKADTLQLMWGELAYAGIGVIQQP